MTVIKTSCFCLSAGINPRTQNKDSLENSVSTSADPSKKGVSYQRGGFKSVRAGVRSGRSE